MHSTFFFKITDFYVFQPSTRGTLGNQPWSQGDVVDFSIRTETSAGNFALEPKET